MRDTWLFVKFKLTVNRPTIGMKTIVYMMVLSHFSSLSIKAVRNRCAARCLSSNMINDKPLTCTRLQPSKESGYVRPDMFVSQAICYLSSASYTECIAQGYIHS